MNICVVGTGYVGLVTGAVFADLGNQVACADRVAEKIEGLRAGRLPIYEPGLEEMVGRNVGGGRLSFTTDLALAPDTGQNNTIDRVTSSVPLCQLFRRPRRSRISELP